MKDFFNGTFGLLFFLIVLIYGLVQTVAGFVGIEMHYGTILAVIAVLLAIFARGIFSIPILIGAFFYTNEVWEWHWFLSLIFVFPGIIYIGIMLIRFIFRNDKGVEQDFKKADTQDDVVAQYNLGYRYLSGQGAKQDYEKAREWYMKAANQGYANAQNNLGNMYESGKGVEQDYEKAREWYTKAANQGFTISQDNLKAIQDK